MQNKHIPEFNLKWLGLEMKQISQSLVPLQFQFLSLIVSGDMST